MKTCLAGVCVLGILFATRVAAAPFEWQTAKPEEVGLSRQRIEALRAGLAGKGTSGLLIIRHDRIVCEWYDGKTQTVDKPHGTASLAKSLVGGMSLAAAMDEGKIRPDDLVAKYVPQWAGDAKKSKITVAELATHTSGLEDAEQGGVAHEKLTGWKGDFWKRTPDPFTISRDQTPVVLEPGARVSYSNPGMAMLSYAVTSAIRSGDEKDVKMLLREKVLRPIGVKDKSWSVGYGKPYRVDGLDLYANWGGAAFTARAAARVGRLMMHEGEWDGRRVIDAKVVRQILDYRTPAVVKEWNGPSSPRPVLGWYSNVDKTWPASPRDAFCGAGAGHQVLLVVPSLDLIVVRNGNLMKHPEGFWAGVEKEIVTPLMGAVTDPANPPSDVIRRVRFDDEKSIIRRAIDSDNWPMTWGDDDAIYTAYGDGRGFEPFVEKKLSLGLARVEGTPPEFKGVNLRSGTAERLGDGARGPKASGMIMVEGVLYMWVRNTGNATLAWSADHGRRWAWGFKFEESFGCPTFLNFGRNDEGARDAYVYVYSQDSAGAYEAAGSAVLARVPKGRIREKGAYEYFVQREGNGRGAWTNRLRERGAVFTNPGHTARLDAVYDAGLKRYLLLVSYGQGKGWGLYEAPEPWGPWKTAFSTSDWGLGGTHGYRLPTKWMSADGRSGWLVFSGTRPNDAFCVRRMVFDLYPPLEAASGQ
jgi:CubicO group peptidase (beta-lactamase class C family)